MARGTESWKAASHKRPPQKNKGKNNKPLPNNKQDSIIDQPAVSTVPLALQQKCLDIFRDALPPSSAGDDDNDAALLQEVKGHLYRRDFAAAFGRDEYLKVYASRWSPSRALGYTQILKDVEEKLLAGHDGTPPLKVVCLGGGAGAEVVALAAWVYEQNGNNPDPPESEAAARQKFAIQALMLDMAAWDSTISALQHAVVHPPTLSKYASAAAKAANVPLLSEDIFQATFLQLDALVDSNEKDNNSNDHRSQAIYATADLITLMFTLNELYSTSVPLTQNLLARITDAAQPGTHLLVVDSPGSYSTVAISGAAEEKKYPMQWLLDHTLLQQRQKRGEQEKMANWEKVAEDQSRWFRLPEGLEYRMELENLRFQIHLYRRLAGEREVEGKRGVDG